MTRTQTSSILAGKGGSMKLLVLTHGRHQKPCAGTGEAPTATTYDGPLEPAVAEALKQLELSEVETVACGLMIRHRQTREVTQATGTKVPVIYTEYCGNDQAMFDIINFGDESPVVRFWEFVMAQKKTGVQSLMIITSRAYLVAVYYMMMPPEKRTKFGRFQYFLNTFEFVTRTEGAVLPALESGQIYEFEV